MFTPDQVVRAAAMVARMGSIPLREQSTGRPTFWSPPICLTKTRPIPASTDWTDYLTLKAGVSFFPEGYGALVNQFIVTGKDDPATSLLQFRFKMGDTLMTPQEFALQATIDYGVDRSATNLSPWPAMTRRCQFVVMPKDSFVLQVKNDDVVAHIAICGLFGWYFPDLSGEGRQAFEASGYTQEDSVRGR